MGVSLQRITVDNWLECIHLKLAEDQEDFVAPNLFSLAEAQFHPSWVPMAIYAGECMVGFIMYGTEEWLNGRTWILRVMVDAAEQRKGYAKEAIKEVIWRVSDHLEVAELYISCHPENVAARRLYASLGFKETGEIEEGEVVACLKLS